MDQVQERSPIEGLQLGGRSSHVLYAPFQVRSEQGGLMGVALPSNFIVEQSSTSRNTLAGLFSLIVERHQGSIMLSSQPGVGTCIRVTLPLHQPREVPTSLARVEEVSQNDIR
ncbi:MAG: ATP-binding protein [Anaerolineae bacterium]|nr:ATP-binding protein [Anaerolineae bacterium]